MHTSTHTYAILEVSSEAYQEIRKKLLDAGYQDQVHSERREGEVIDMHGIAIKEEKLEIPLKEDKQPQGLTSLPLPPFHADFTFDAKTIEEVRKMTEEIDKKINQRLEDHYVKLAKKLEQEALALIEHGYSPKELTILRREDDVFGLATVVPIEYVEQMQKLWSFNRGK